MILEHIIPASIRNSVVMADGSPVKDSWLCKIFDEEEPTPTLAQIAAKGLLEFLAKYHKKAKLTHAPTFVLNSDNERIAVFIRGHYCGYIRWGAGRFVIGSPNIFQRRLRGGLTNRQEAATDANSKSGVSRAIKLALQYLTPPSASMLHNTHRMYRQRAISGLTEAANTYMYSLHSDTVLRGGKFDAALAGVFSGGAPRTMEFIDKDRLMAILYLICRDTGSDWSTDEFQSPEEIVKTIKETVIRSAAGLEKFTNVMGEITRLKIAVAELNQEDNLIMLHVAVDNSVSIIDKTQYFYYGDMGSAPEWVERTVNILNVAEGDVVPGIGARTAEYSSEKFTCGDKFMGTGAYYAVLATAVA